MKVLLADDDPGILETTSDILRTAGFDVTAVADGRLAAAAVSRDRFDIVVLDVMMPGLNGVETVDEIRKTSPDVRFVIITAYSDSELVDDVRRRGVSDIFFKPFDVAVLLSRLESIRRELVCP